MNKIIRKNLVFLVFIILATILITAFQFSWYLGYFIYILFFIAYSTIAIIQLERFCYVGDAARPVMIIYITLSLSVIATSIVLLILSGGINAR